MKVFFPDWRSRDNPNASFFVQSGLICQKIVRVFWRADVTGALTDVRGSYESQRGSKLYSLHAPEVECIGKSLAPRA